MKTIRPLLNSSLLFVSLLLISLAGFSQQTLTTINGWNAYVHLPDDYNATGNKQYPAIIFFPGTGETGTYAPKLLAYGPSHFIAAGSNMNSFVVNGQTIKPIIISVQPDMLYPQPWQLNLLFDAILSRWRVDPNRLNLTGLSMGGFCGDNFVTESWANAKRINSMVNMSAVSPNFPIVNFAFFALTGGKAWWFEGVYDNRGMDQMAAVMNAFAPGSARYTSYVGGHCCWNTWYDPTYTENVNGQNWNIYQWMLAQNKSGVPSPPSVSAGPDQTINGGKVDLTGSASGNNGANIVSTTWTEISGPNSPKIHSSSQLSTKITGLQTGVYVFMLNVTDDRGLSNSSTVTITVNPAQQPTVGAGSAQTITQPANSVNLTGTARGNNGANITATTWTEISGPNAAAFGSPASLSTSASGLIAGIYTFKLTALDDNNGSGSAQVTITVNAMASVPPTVNAGSDQSISLPSTTVSLAGRATGNGANITGTAWTEMSGPNAANINSAYSLSTQVSGLIAGVYVFKLTAKDNNGLSASSTLTVTVSSSQPPTVNAGIIQVMTLPFNTANLSGTASASNGASISSTTWSENSGPNTASFSAASSLSTTVNGLTAGNYVFKLTATDNKGLSNSSTVTIIVNAPIPPTVYAGSAQSITSPVNSVNLTGFASGNYGAAIKSTSWTESSGPNTASIGTPSSLTTAVSGLIAGVYIFKLTAVDNDGLSSSATITISVNPSAHVPPSVDAGIDKAITLPVSSVSLTGTASGNNGATIASILWSQTSGPNSSSMTSTGSLTTSITGLTQGVYVFQILVTDNNGLTSTSTASVTVNAANLPPSVNAGPAQTISLPANSVNLTGSASGKNGATIATTAWTQVSGPNSASLSSPSGLNSGVSGLVAGVYVFKLTATDNKGQTNSSIISVTVNPPAQVPPTVDAGADKVITLPVSSVSLTGTASGNNGATIASILWSQTSGPNTPSISSPGNLSTNIIGFTQGVYVFQISVTDNNGLSNTSTATVTVNPGILPPSVNAGPGQTIVLPASSVTLTGSASGRNGATISTTTWSQVSGPNSASLSSPSSLSSNASGLIQGVYVFKLSATDNNSQTNSGTLSVTVNAATKVPPTVSAGPNQAITLPNNSVTLSGTTTANQGASISSSVWAQTGGPNSASINTPSSLNCSVSGLVAGVYTFELTVTDNNGLSSVADVSITVNDANLAPSVNAGKTQSISSPASSVTLTGTANGTNGATITAISWIESSGPNTASIGTPSNLTTTITGLIAGIYIFKLTAFDNNALSSSATVTITVHAATNVPPTVNAGSNQMITLPVSTVTLTGTASGNNGASISGTGWVQTDGPNSANINVASSLTSTVTGLIAGIYTFELTATDNNGLSSVSDVTITVNDANIPPSVNAGKAQSITSPANTITLNGTANGMNGASITSFIWTESSGPNTASIQAPSNISTTVDGLIVGVYTFKLSATDNNGLSNSSVVTITVHAASTVAPSVDAGTDQTISLPVNSVVLVGSASGNNGATLTSTSWTETSGPNSATLAASSYLSTTATDLVKGVYTFQLSATDNHGLSSTSSVTITVNAETQKAPTVNAGSDQSITLPANSVTLSGTAAPNNGATIIRVEWTQVSGPNSATIAAGSNLSTLATGLDKGVYTFQLSATDNNGLSGTSSIKVTVNAEAQVAPTVIAGSDLTITLPTNTVTLSATATPNNGASIINVQWQEVSGPNTVFINSPVNLSTTVTGLIQGTYTFTFVATDNGGLSSLSAVTVTVNPVPNQPPVSKAGPDQTITLPVNSVTLDGTGSFDPDGSIVSYNWNKISGSGGITIVNSNSPTATADNLQAGQYVFELTVTDNAGAATNSQVSITVNPAIAEPPVANAGHDTIIAIPADTTILNGTASMDSNGVITTYQWQEVSGPTNASISPSNSPLPRVSDLVVGDYVFELVVTNNAGLSARASVKVKVVAPFRYTSQLLLYPNPAHDLINLHLMSDSLGKVQINIYDLNGRLVQAEQLEKAQGYFDKTFDISRLSNGLYILEAIVGTQNMTSKKFIKQ